jgi:hypothetical protein
LSDPVTNPLEIPIEIVLRVELNDRGAHCDSPTLTSGLWPSSTGPRASADAAGLEGVEDAPWVYALPSELMLG